VERDNSVEVGAQCLRRVNLRNLRRGRFWDRLVWVLHERRSRAPAGQRERGRGDEGSEGPYADSEKATRQLITRE
jgi:hypothetical protein